jgi:hypothetical protein
VEHVDFVDNQQCLDLIEGKGNNNTTRAQSVIEK